MLLLAFDTATPAVTVALYDGRRALAETAVVDARRHGELLAPCIAKVLADAGAAQADLTAVAVGVGPGPYTGMRVAVVTARVLGGALGIPVHGVCTLDVLARAAVPAAAGREFLVATDARRKEVYWARYSASGDRQAGPAVSRPADIPGAGTVPAAGPGCALYPDALGEPLAVPGGAAGPGYPSAAILAALAAERLPASGDAPAQGGVTLLPPEPLYLRRPDARPPGAPKRVTAP